MNRREFIQMMEEKRPWRQRVLLSKEAKALKGIFESLSRFNINYYSALEGILEETVPQVDGEIDREFNLTLSGGMMGSPIILL